MPTAPIKTTTELPAAETNSDGVAVISPTGGDTQQSADPAEAAKNPAPGTHETAPASHETAPGTPETAPVTPEPAPGTLERETADAGTADSAQATAEQVSDAADAGAADASSEQTGAKPEPEKQPEPATKAKAAAAPEIIAAPETLAEPGSAAETNAKAPEEAKPKSKAKAEPKTQSISLEDFAALQEELKRLNVKQTGRIEALRNSGNRLRKFVGDDEALQAASEALQQAVAPLWQENQNHQKQLQKASVELIEKVRVALEAGQSTEALNGWDKLQSNLSNTSGAIKAELSTLSAEFKAPIKELRDWKAFAATEKKKQLIEQIEKLPAADMQAGELAKQISSMHKEWKKLGYSNDNEALWKQFKALSDIAYEPCKEYFKERKAQMAENLQKRREICAQLEKDAAALDGESVNLADVNKLISSAEKQWKKYAPVEQSKIKKLQKQFYSVVNSLRKLRRDAVKTNAAAKQELIDTAQKLAESEDNKAAMNEAKALQKQWKAIGPTSYKEDQKYWHDFRAACDKIFAPQNEAAAKLLEDLEQGEKTLREVLKSLEELAELEGEELRGSKGRYQELSQSFSQSLDPRLKQKKTLQDSFNRIKRRIDMRFKALPDKRMLQAKEDIKARLELLQPAEQAMFTAADAPAFTAAAAAMDQSAWQACNSLADDSLEALLQARWDGLAKVSDQPSFTALVDAAREQQRRDCIELEIKSNTETPQQDQALRMEIQLSQLQSKFGQGQSEQPSGNKFAQSLLLKSECYGPLPVEEREQFQARLRGASERLS